MNHKIEYAIAALLALGIMMYTAQGVAGQSNAAGLQLNGYRTIEQYCAGQTKPVYVNNKTKTPKQSSKNKPKEALPQLKLIVMRGLSEKEHSDIGVAINVIGYYAPEVMKQIVASGCKEIYIEKDDVGELLKLTDQYYKKFPQLADKYYKLCGDDAITIVMQEKGKPPEIHIVISPKIFGDFARLIVILAHELGGHGPQYARLQEDLKKGTMPISRPEQEIIAHTKEIKILEKIIADPALRQKAAPTIQAIEKKYLPDERKLLADWKRLLALSK